MMLALQKCGEPGRDDSFSGHVSFIPAADYAWGIIDTAMLRGELRCRPSGEMAHYYLLLTRELLSLMASVQRNKTSLRKEVRRRTADFLDRYAADATA